MRGHLLFISMLLGLSSCGPEPTTLCVFDSENASYELANPMAVSEDCRAAGDFDEEEYFRRRGDFGETGDAPSDEELAKFREIP